MSDQSATRSAVGALLERFEEAWGRGGRPNLLNYVLPAGHPEHTESVRVLVEVDLEYRLRAGDEAPLAEMYFRLFPQELADPAVAAQVVAAEYQWRWRRGDPGLGREEYRSRFPHLEQALEACWRLGWQCPECGRSTGDVQGDTADGPACPHCGVTWRVAPRVPETLAPPEARPAALTGSDWPAIPGYEIEAELGRGGMGVVYKARQVGGLGLGRWVALKMILAGAQAGPEDLTRFQTEAQAVARLRHPNIVQLYAGDKFNGQPYVAFEFVEGGTLARQLDGTPRPAQDAARLVETLADAVHTAHEAGVLHRDLKPANILLTADGTPKIADFGLAKFLDATAGPTQTGDMLGTPRYMAPEQIAGPPTPVGPAADVYALGAILYELLTGRPPFVAENRLETMRQVATQEPVPPRRLQARLPRDLETICLKCLQKEPRARYAAARDLADDLRRFREGRPIKARPVSAAGRLLRWGRRNPMPAGLAALLALAVLLGLGGVGWEWYRAESQRRAAEQEGDRARRNRDQALAAARVLVHQLAEGVKPIAGTQSPEVERILTNVAAVYDALRAEDPSPEVLADQAEMLNALADIYLDMNRTAEAGKRLEQAQATWNDLGEGASANPRFRAGRARTLDLQGRVFVDQGSLPRALECFRESLAIRRRLAEEEPENPEWQSGIAWSHVLIGSALERQWNTAGQKAAYEEALRIRRRLAEWDPANVKWQEDLAKSLEKMGDYFFYVDPDQALEQYRGALAIDRALLEKNPGNTFWQRNTVQVLTSLGQTYQTRAARTEAAAADRERWRGEAGACLREAHVMAKRVSQLNPANVTWKTEYLRSQLHLSGLAEPRKGERAQAIRERLQTLDKLCATTQGLADQDASNYRWPDELVILQMETANLYRQLAADTESAGEKEKALRRALAAADRAEELQRPLPARDPTNQNWVSRGPQLTALKERIYQELQQASRR